jgi:hypothetical protein
MQLSDIDRDDLIVKSWPLLFFKHRGGQTATQQIFVSHLRGTISNTAV